MKEIQFNGKQYNCPTSWEDITIGMVIKVSEYEQLIEDAPIISIICGYLGINDKELKKSGVSEVQEIMETMDFIYTPYVPIPITRFKFGDVEYSINESLEEVEFQDWVSVQTILYQHRDNQALGLHKLIAVVCKRDGESLDDFKVEDRSQMFMELPFTTAKDIECFFLNSQIALNAITLLSSTIPEQEQLVLHKFNELNAIMKQRQVERGWYSPTGWLIGIYRLYLNSLKHRLELYFNSQHTELSKRSWIQTCKSSLTKRFSGSIRVSKQ